MLDGVCYPNLNVLSHLIGSKNAMERVINPFQPSKCRKVGMLDGVCYPILNVLSHLIGSKNDMERVINPFQPR